MPLSRRRFMRETALAAGGLALAGTARAEKDIPMSTASPSLRLHLALWQSRQRTIAANRRTGRLGPRRGRARHPRCRGRRRQCLRGIGGHTQCPGRGAARRLHHGRRGPARRQRRRARGNPAPDLGGAPGDGRDQARHARRRRGAAVRARAGFCQRRFADGRKAQGVGRLAGKARRCRQSRHYRSAWPRRRGADRRRLLD